MASSDAQRNVSSSQAPALERYHILEHGTIPAQPHPSNSSTASTAVLRSKQPDSAQASAARHARDSVSESLPSKGSRLENHTLHREVRSLPPWIDSFEESGDLSTSTKPTDRLLPSPSRSHAAQHHYGQSQLERKVSQDGFVDDFEEVAQEKKTDTGFFGGHREPVKGRKWDHAREGEPVIIQSGRASASPWHTFLMSSMYGPAPTEDGKKVDADFLQQQTPGYMKPWRGDLDENADPEKLAGLLHNKKRRKSFISRLQYVLLMHPLVPLVFRIIVLTTSTIALGLSGSIYHLSNKYKYLQNPSTTMAIVVDVVAMPYILYVTWDEYTGKPLGLRSPKAKIRLVLLDLFFIIFESANLALAFGALTDPKGSCQSGAHGVNFIICGRVRALSGILMVALIAWSMTFAVSIFRLVERVGGREEVE